MIKDGKYASWFRTSHGQGTGIVYLADGEISGGDSVFTYSGSYQVDGDRFTATLRTTRHAEGPSTVFGVDDIELKVAGSFNGTIATCTGTAEQAPGVSFEATLFPSHEESPVSQTRRATPNFSADRLPKGLDGRSHDPRFPGRNPFPLTLLKR
jgi:hypothetical protein